MRVLDREDRWFEGGVKDTTYVKLDQISLDRRGGLRHRLSVTYDAVLKSLFRKLNHSSHLNSCETNDSHDDRGSDYPAVGGWI